MNHDVYDTPEDIAREAEQRGFQENAQEVHYRLLAMPASKFTVSELDFLFTVPVKPSEYAFHL